MKKELEQLISDYRQLLLKYERYGEDEERKQQIKKELEECEQLLYNYESGGQDEITVKNTPAPAQKNPIHNTPALKNPIHNIVIKIRKLISYIQN